MSGGSETRSTLSTKTTGRSALSSSERLRRVRSDRYCAAIRELDAGGHSINPDRLAAISDAIAGEFPEGPGSWPLGWVGKCYLGVPYEVHLLDVTGQIVQHFKVGEALPDGMERARRLAASGKYVVIEVFSDRVVAVAADGTTAVSA
jgi:hypothetical protein